ACGGSLNFTLSQSEFGFDDIGNVEVILYAEDCAGNTASGTAVVTVIGPSAVIAYTGDKHGQYSDQITLSAILTDENTGAPLSNRNLVFTLGTQAFAAVTNASGVASADLVLNQEPGLYDLLLEFEGDDVYPATSAIEVFEILPENANLTYIGTRLLATKTGTTVNLDLRVVLEDVEDDFRGEIINTDVTFLISWGGNSEIITTVLTPDNLVSNQKAVLSVPFPVTLAQGEVSRTLNILVTAGDYYTGEEQVVAVVYLPSGDHITGGGFIVPGEGSSGLYPSAPGSHANFGFNFRYHPKTGKLKGRANLIIRGESGPPVKFKSTQPLSMGINNSGDHPTAQFTVKGDLTQGGTLLFSDVMMYVTLTDRGNPGFKDDIGFTIWSGNTLIYSSDWQGNFTERQNLGGGNLVIHRGGTDAGEDVDILADPVLGGIEGDARFSETMGLNVYPNPFRGKLTLSFTPQTRQRVVVEIYDMSGKLVETIFDAEVLENDQYTIEYIPAERKTAVLFYRFIAGEKVIHGKIIQQQ
ncbi:MAG: T9SS type A sorting domain-containing protein, partial [Bacteroidota bacterium]